MPASRPLLMRPYAESIQVRGLVQGVGFRPTVWRLGHELGLAGDVRNDGSGILVRLWGSRETIETFCRRLLEQAPPLSRIDSVERAPMDAGQPPQGFKIADSEATPVSTGIVPDAATCGACGADISDPANRRFRYPFTNCTHCGPRLSIVRAIPYDRDNTSMDAFPMCRACRAEYDDPEDRRFHAQPNACPDCGPRVWLQDTGGTPIDASAPGAIGAIDAASRLLEHGRILAIKGIGGFHLACDATNPGAVARLRRRKRRYHKPFALMARNIDVIRRYAAPGAPEIELLGSPAAPVVLLERTTEADDLAPDLAPGRTTIGFMLPYSPLHHLLLAGWDRPLVMTSGNLSDEPQCIDNGDAGGRLGDIADAFLLHDRPIVNRVDDSVVQTMDGTPRLLRRARGYAPAPLLLEAGFASAPRVLALGGELKNTLCLLRDGKAILSQHLGDLEDARTAEEFERAIALYSALFEHHPEVLAVDRHPGYRSTQFGQTLARREGLSLVEVQHHHAHVAAVLAENARSPDSGPVLGITLDGLGYGADGTLWGGEFLVADYAAFERVAALKSTPMPGGVRAVLEPWRNTWAHIATHVGWEQARARWPGLEAFSWLDDRPLATLERMVEQDVNSPLASSCGRLFDAVAGALGICREAVSYEGQAASELESLASRASGEVSGYPFGTTGGNGMTVLDPAPMWTALLRDLHRAEAPERIAMRFHLGLAQAVVQLAAVLCERHSLSTVALSGGVFQNLILFESVCRQARRLGLTVLTHTQVPANDGGLSLGQATIAAVRCAGGPATTA